MPPVVIDIRTAEDLRDVVHRAVQALAEGELVAFPTETVYGVAASALNEAAVAELMAAKGRAPSNPLPLAVKSADDAADFVPDMPALARRLARRCWPGPVTLVLEATHPEGLLGRLPELVRRAVAPNGTVGLRVPAHPLIVDVLRLSAGPLVLTSANRSGEPDAVTADEVVAKLGDKVGMVLDDGRSRFGQPSSVVRVEPRALRILRAGVVSEENLRHLASFMVLIVCTGNTCRSPMAEVLLRKRIAERLGCSLEDLDECGAVIISAGVAAMTGGRPTPEAVAVMAERGLDLSFHESQPVTERLMRQADVILAMTRSHRDAISMQWPAAADRTRVLCRNGADVADPIGGSKELYGRCADQIDEQLEAYVADWDLGTTVSDWSNMKGAMLMRIAIGNDHRGYLVKEKLIRTLEQLGHEVQDDGTDSSRPIDYPDVAAAVCRRVAGSEAERGILICGTGVGMCIAANKTPGIRAAACHDELTAEIIRRHNDTNVLCLAADMLGGREFDRMVQVWLDTPFDGGRHARRLEKIAEMEGVPTASEAVAESLDDRPADFGG